MDSNKIMSKCSFHKFFKFWASKVAKTLIITMHECSAIVFLFVMYIYCM